MKQTFGKIPRSLMALKTGTHSPWVSRLLTELGHEVIVAHAQEVQLIIKSNRKDDRHDARTLARLARIDPELLGPVRHRSAQAQIHLTVIRARADRRARTPILDSFREPETTALDQRRALNPFPHISNRSKSLTHPCCSCSVIEHRRGAKRKGALRCGDPWLLCWLPLANVALGRCGFELMETAIASQSLEQSNPVYNRWSSRNRD
jgi:hypothetical protein